MSSLFLGRPELVGMLLLATGTVTLVFSAPLARLDRHLERFVMGGIAEKVSLRWVEASGALTALLGLALLIGSRLV